MAAIGTLQMTPEQRARIDIDRMLQEAGWLVQDVKTTIETNLKRAERLRQTILQQAFSVGLAL